MITAETAHVFAMKARDGEDSIVGQFLSKLDAMIQERSRQGMFWMYICWENDDLMRNASEAEVKWVRLQLEKLGYAITNYKVGTWGIAW